MLGEGKLGLPPSLSSHSSHRVSPPSCIRSPFCPRPSFHQHRNWSLGCSETYPLLLDSLPGSDVIPSARFTAESPQGLSAPAACSPPATGLPSAPCLTLANIAQGLPASRSGWKLLLSVYWTRQRSLEFSLGFMPCVLVLHPLRILLLGSFRSPSSSCIQSSENRSSQDLSLGRLLF